MRLAVTTNTKETVLQQMCCLDPTVVPIGPIVRRVIAFPRLGTRWDATTQVASQSVHWQAARCENRAILRSSVLTYYQRVTDRQTYTSGMCIADARRRSFVRVIKLRTQWRAGRQTAALDQRLNTTTTSSAHLHYLLITCITYQSIPVGMCGTWN